MITYIYDRSTNEPIQPRQYPNGLSQFDISQQVLAALRIGEVVVLRQGPGTGKSIIAIDVASKFIDLAGIGEFIDERHKAFILTPVNAIATMIHYDFRYKFYIATHLGSRTFNISTIFGKGRYSCIVDPTKTAEDAICSVGPLRKRFDKCPHFSPMLTEQQFQHVKSIVSNYIRYQCITGTCYIVGAQSTQCPYFIAQNESVLSPITVTNPRKYVIHYNNGTLQSHKLLVIDEVDVSLKQMEPVYEASYQDMSQIATKLRSNYNMARIYNTFNNVGNVYEVIEEHRAFWTTMRDLLYQDLYNCLDACKDDSCVSSCYGNYSALMYYINEKLKYLSLLDEGGIISRSKKSMMIIPYRMGKYFRDMFRDISVFAISATPPSTAELKAVYGIDYVTNIAGYAKLLGPVYAGFVGAIDRATKNIIKYDMKVEFVELLIRNIKAAMKWKPVLIQVVAWDIWEDPVVRNALEQIGITESHIDRDGSAILKLREGKLDVVVSSFATRGIDLPHGLLRSIVIPKAPFPDLEDPRVKYYNSVLGHSEFQSWYHKQMLDNLYQMVARGVRDFGDWVVVFSPDFRVYKGLRDLAKLGLMDVVFGKAPKPKDLDGLDGVVEDGDYIIFTQLEKYKDELFL